MLDEKGLIGQLESYVFHPTKQTQQAPNFVDPAELTWDSWGPTSTSK